MRRAHLLLILLLFVVAGCGRAENDDFTTYTSEDLGLRFRYPNAWQIDESGDGLLTITSQEATADQAPNEGALISLFAGDTADLGTSDPVALLERFIATAGLSEQSGATIVQPPTPFEQNGLDAATAVIEGTEGDLTLTVGLTLITDGERLAVAITAAPSEQAETYGDDLEAIVESLEFVREGE